MRKNEEFKFKVEELKVYPYLEKLHIGQSVIALEGDIFEGMKGEIVGINYNKEDRETENESVVEIVVSFDERDFTQLRFKKNFEAHYETMEDVSIDYVVMDEETIGILDMCGLNYKTLKGESVCMDCGKVLVDKQVYVENSDRLCEGCFHVRGLFNPLAIVTYDSHGIDSQLKKYDGQRCIVLGYQLQNVDIQEVGLMFNVRMQDGKVIEAFQDELQVDHLTFEGKDEGTYPLYDLEVLCKGVQQKGPVGIYKLLKEQNDLNYNGFMEISMIDQKEVLVYESEHLQDLFIQNNIEEHGYVEDVIPSAEGRKVMLLCDTEECGYNYYATVEVQEVVNRKGDTLPNEIVYYMNTLTSYREDVALAERLEACLTEKNLLDEHVREQDEFSDNQAMYAGAACLLAEMSFEEALECGRKVAQSEIFCEERFFLQYTGELEVYSGKDDFASNANLTIPSVIVELTSGKIVRIYG